MIRDYGLGDTENALKSWRLNYTQNDDISVIEQLTDNIALVEFVLKDKEHLMEHLEELTRIIRELKVFGAAAVYKSYEGSAMIPDVSHFLTEEEKEAVQEINHPSGNFIDFFDDDSNVRHRK